MYIGGLIYKFWMDLWILQEWMKVITFTELVNNEGLNRHLEMLGSRQRFYTLILDSSGISRLLKVCIHCEFYNNIMHWLSAVIIIY